MPAELFDERGPEANLRRAAEFETQLDGMAATLGWETVCHNVDVFIKSAGSNPSRGIDVLWAFANPQTGDNDGVLGEAKIHKTQQGLSKLQDELQTLHDKMGEFSKRQAFLNNEYIRDHVEAIRWGLLAHKTQKWNPDANSEALRSVKLKSLRTPAHITTIVFAGPDTLNAFADCVLHLHDGDALTPAEFYWPAHEDADAVWATVCPPHQLAEGLLAYKTEQGHTVLWLRDTLTVADMSHIKDIAFAWKLDVNAVVCSELTQDARGLLLDPWRKTAKDADTRRTGTLPDPAHMYARGLKPYTNLHRFDDAWPIQEIR
jgi:hypothetical protein